MDDTGRLDDAVLAAVAAAVGTPTYVYSLGALAERVAAARQAAARVAPAPPAGAGHRLCYAVKANGNVSLLRWLGEQGLGADVTSAGELYLAVEAGIEPTRILFSGVGKTTAEIEMALAAGIRALHVESPGELAEIARQARARRQAAAIGVRVNPGIAAATHPAIQTGASGHKFGLPGDAALDLMRQAAADPWLRPVGLAAHIGSQIRELAPLRQTAGMLVELAARLAVEGVRLDYLDVGGGLGIGPGAPSIAAWIEAVGAPVARAGYRLVLEPGRALVGPAGVLLTRVVAVKAQGGKAFVVVDAGMSELIRPALYGAEHPIRVIGAATGAGAIVDVVGPLCETGDVLARDRPLPMVAPGDLLALEDVGAYGFAMSSNYNGRLRAAEVLVEGEAFRVIRPRQQLADLLR